MAKKINVKLILELRSAGMGRNAIAASRHISKNSVGDVFHIADRMGISYEDIAQMDEDTVYRKFYPDKFALESLYDKPDYDEYSVRIMQLFRTFSAGHPEIRCSDSGCQCSPL